jgi:murein DD-endopeptidase MepM/ murein hydrolase activator NlpD
MTTSLRRLRLIALLGMAVTITFAVTRLIGERATFRQGDTRRPADWLRPVGADAQGQPIYAYAAVDPALVPALEAAGSFDAPAPLFIVARGVVPLGVYLPAAGDMQFQLPAPTPTPTVSPLPTVTALPATISSPAASLPPTIPALPTLTPAPTYDVNTLHLATAIALLLLPAPYGGDNCAPGGWPAPGVLTQYFHWHHRGLDVGVPLNTPVRATHSGRVMFAGWRTNGYGNLVIIANGQFATYYGHLTDFNVIEGDIVGKGSIIAWSGSTGNSSGPHIHYEIRINDAEVDPLTFEERGYQSC